MRTRSGHFMRLGALLFILLSSLGPGRASAISLNFLPASQTINLGEQATVDVVVAAPSGNLIGAYDFFVNYDPAVISFSGLTFGTGLGGPADSLQDVLEDPTGSVNVAELSLVSDLSGLQDGTSDLLLFSMTFTPVNFGTSTLMFSENILGIAGGFLGDAVGLPIELDSLGTGSITVVPVPASIWLLGSALVGLLPFWSYRGRKVAA